MLRIFFIIGFLSVFLSACTYESVEPKAIVVVTDSVISYSKTIVPLVTTQCNDIGCHDSGSQDGDFTNYTGVQGKASDGSLLKRVVTLKDMPQGGSGFTLTDKERGYFEAWIKQGFPDN